jgi:alkylation response protein AidB-like acyl-CoA dehydrogenase
MEFEFTPEQEKLRAEVREFLNRELPADWVGYTATTVDDHVDHRPDGFDIFKKMARKMGEKGWLSMTWPKEYGGQASSYVTYLVFLEEIAKRGSPGHNAVGPKMLAPTLMKFASDEQKKHFLPGIAAGTTLYTESFSEPEAGSDLASLQTRGIRDGHVYVVNGQKTWASFSPYADYCVALIRTDPSSQRHHGLSLFLVDLKTPGVTVSAIANLHDEPHFGEIFFEDVRVPESNRIGNENEGWLVAQTFLSYERVAITPIAALQGMLEKLVKYAAILPDSERKRIGAVAGRLSAEIDVGRLLSYQVAWLEDQHRATEWDSAMTRLYGTRLWKKAASEVVNLLGLYGRLDDKDPLAPVKGWFEHFYLSSIGSTLAAGTTEIQKTVLAVRGLGLKA